MQTIKTVKKQILGWFRNQPNDEFRFPNQTGVIVRALHKSASMFLHKFFADLCQKTGTPLFSIHNSPPDHLLVDKTRAESFVICPVRSFDIYDFDFSNLNRLQQIIQVRDPRDILVSEYYSLGWRHSDQHWDETAKARRRQIQQVTIDEFVLNESLTGKTPLLDRMSHVLDVQNREDVTLVYYETLVTRFEDWVATVLDAIGMCSGELHRILCEQYLDEFQPEDSATGHKRNITPGDHKRKLKPATIELLNQRFECVLDSLGYEK